MKNTNEKYILCLIGPSGSGKTSIGKHMEKYYDVPEIISHTTREPRKGEKEGVNYYFIEKEDFDKLEKVESVAYCGNHYCISRQEIQRILEVEKKEMCFAVVTYDGYQAIAEYFKELPSYHVISIFIDTSPTLCAHRMRLRGDSEESIEKRLKKAQAGEYDVKELCDRVFNNNLEMKYQDVETRFLLTKITNHPYYLWKSPLTYAHT